MPEWYEGDGWFPSEFGASDEMGTLNLVDQRKVLRALSIPKRGRVYRLAHEIYNGMPGRTQFHGPFFYLISQRVYDHRPPFRKPAVNRFGGALGRLEMSDHAGTHIDALNHIAVGNRYYNGIDAFDVTGTQGTTRLGIDKTPPIVTRGIMVDVASALGVDILEKGHAITVDEAKRFLRDHSLSIEAGDAVFFHTGISRLWENPSEYNTYYESSPGVGYELAKYLASLHVSVVGADVPSTEVEPAEIEGARLPVHQYLIAKSGIRMIDNMKLDEVSRDRVYEFLFLCSPLPIRGGTASPVAPVAVS